MRKALSILLSLSLLISMAPAQAQAAMIPKGEQVEVFFKWAQTGGFLGIAKNSSGKEMFRIAADPTSKEILRQFGPRALSQTFKNAAVGTGAIMIKKLQRFPVESLGFFVALGAVMTFNMTFAPAHNPAGYQQLVDSQMDPLGQFAFYSFMVANGMVSEPMMAMVQNGKWNQNMRHFIPYLGMSVGMTASHIVHELGHAKELHQCVADFTSFRDATESCEAAHEAWMARGGLGGLTHELAPSLIGLIGSTILAGGAQKAAITVARASGASVIIKVAGNIAVGSVIKLIGVEVLTFVIPGGVVIKFIRGAFGFVAQMAFFTWVQEFIQPSINHFYRNMTDGTELDHKVRALSVRVRQERESGWNPSPKKINEGSNEVVLHLLPEISKRFSGWRQANMEQVLIVQGNWEQATGQLAQQYRVARDFYADLIDNLWQKENGRYKDNFANGIETHLLDRPAPLYGIPTVANTEEDPKIFSQAPDKIEEGQVAYIHHIVGNFGIGIPRVERMDAKSKVIWDGILKNLGALSEPVALGREIDRIRCISGFPLSSDQVETNTKCTPTVSKNLEKNIRTLLNELNNNQGWARPDWNKGKTYVTAYVAENDLAKIEFSTPPNTLAFKNTVDKLLGFASTGPIAGQEKTIIDEAGYPAKFMPPRLVTEKIKLKDSIYQYRNPYNPFIGMTGSIERTRQECGAAFDCLLDNLSPQVYNANDHLAFDKWWESKVEPEYISTWVKFEQKYQYNIGLLVNALWQDRSFWNGGLMANGIVKSYFEEARMYLAVLGHIARDQITKERGAIPKALLGPSTNIGVFNMKNTGPAFHWQLNYLNDLQNLTKLLKSVEVKRIKTYTGNIEDLPVSNLTAAQLEKHSEIISARVKEILEFMQTQVKLSKYQEAVVSVSLQNLMALQQEIKTLGLIINAASYRERHDVPGGYQSPTCESVKKRSLGMSVNMSVQTILAGCQK
jgi:hypothetical protein